MSLETLPSPETAITTPESAARPAVAETPTDPQAAQRAAFDKAWDRLQASDRLTEEGRQDRGPDGKFTKASLATAKTTDSETAEADTETDTAPPETITPSVASKNVDQKPDVAKVEPAKPAIDAPASWSAEMRSAWSALPPDVQTYVAGRDREATQAISRLGQDARDLRQKIEHFVPLSQIIDKHAPTLEAWKMRPDQVFDNLVQTASFIESDPRAAIQWLAQTHKVDLRSLAGPDASDGDMGLAPNPELQSLKSEIDRLKAEANDLKRASNERSYRERVARDVAVRTHEARAVAEVDRHAAAIAEFARDKPDFSTVLPDLQPIILALQAQHPGMAVTELLTAAYDRARWANPAIRARLVKEESEAQERARVEATKRAAEAARKAAAVNVKGVDAKGPPPKLSPREAFDKAWDSYHSNRAA